VFSAVLATVHVLQHTWFLFTTLAKRKEVTYVACCERHFCMKITVCFIDISITTFVICIWTSYTYVQNILNLFEASF